MAFRRLSPHRRTGREQVVSRTPLLACMTLVILLAMMVFALQARAEGSVLPMLTLNNSTTEIPLSRYTLVQNDPEGKVTPASIHASGGTILNGAVSKLDMVNLGYDGDPVWLTLKIGNTGTNDSWVIDLGRRSQGRLGYLETAHAYEMTISGENGIVVSEIFPLNDKGAYEFDIPRNTEKYILFNIKPAAGKPSVLPMKLYSEKEYLHHTGSLFTPFAIHCFFLLAYALFFASIAYARGQKSLLVFSAFFLYELCIWSITENMGAVIGFGLLDIIIPCMMLGFTLFSILLLKIFFKIEYGSFTERYILYGLAWLNILASLLAFLLPVSGGLTQISLLYGAPFITFTILCLMAGAQSANGHTAGRFYFVGSLFPVLGLFCILMGFMGFVPQHPFFINALWYAVGVQGFFMILATHKKLQTAQGTTTTRVAPGEVDFSKLRETRDTADHTRLLKVIEKERELLAEFRAKENERVNEMRTAKEIADEANRAKSAFLAVVSHEIRTPMTGVMGMVRLLLDSSITKQQRDYVLTIQESSEAMMALLNDILDFERIQRGKMELENISFDLHRLIQGVITLMSGHAAEKGISLSARVDDDLPKFVKGDPTRLRQVLLNLMGNAIKFTDKGNVTLLVKNMNQSEDTRQIKGGAAEKYMIYFAVQDTGIGISGQQKKNLFTPFAQANSTIARKFGGTGLGLAISKGLIENMGSAININSKEDEGSTFFFTLDMDRGIASSNEKSMPARSEEKRPTLPLRILIVDDNAITKKVMIGFLEGGHHDILTAADAEEALKKINQDAFDLIFMDIELPGMKGNEATKILREHRDRVKAAIPVIAMTGNIAKEDKERYLADGMSGFLPKPIEAEDVRSIVEEIGHKSFEREIRTPQPGIDPFAQTPEEIAAHAKKLEEMPHDANVFNPDMLQSLKDTIGAKQLGELLTELIVKTDEILVAMDDATKQNDLVTLAARAHELKGMAGNFGLVEISAIAAQAERKAKTSDTADLSALIGTLPDANLRAQIALKDWSSY